MKGKSEIRKEISLIRKTLTKEKKAAFDAKILKTIISNNYYIQSNVIFVYVSYLKEVETHNFIKTALKDKKVICVPKVISKEKGMKAVIIENFNDLKEGAYGILEPITFDNAIKEEKIDLAIIPGVAFDIGGGRIGYGGGFYDRFLNKLRIDAYKIALSYNFQIFEEVPTEKHDVKINGIITEEKFILI